MNGVAVDAATTPRLRVPVGGMLTPRAERLIRAGSVGSALIIATCAMVLSYSGLLDLALDAQIHPKLALLVPIMVDGLQFVGSLGVVYSTLSGLRSWYPWMLMLLGVSISSWGNWQAAPDDLTAKLLHAAAPLILALVLEELLRVMRHKVHLHTHAVEVNEAIASNPHVEGETSEPVPQPDGEPFTGFASTTVEAAVQVTPDEPSLEPSATEHAEIPSRVVEKESTPPPVAPAEVPAVTPTVVSGGDYDENVLPPYPEGVTFKEQVKEILLVDPDIKPAKIARLMGKDPSWTRKAVREVRAELDNVGTPRLSGEQGIETSSTATPPVAQEPRSTASVNAPLTVPVATGTPAPRVDPVEDTLADADPFAGAVPTLASR